MDRIRRALNWLLGTLAAAPTTTKLMLATVGVIVVLTAAAVRLHPSPNVLAAFYAPLFGALLLFVLRRLRFDTGTTIILLAAFGLYLAYLSYTQYGERNYDGPAQVEYITYIVQHKTLPPVTHCFICHHPPAYYLLAAFPYAFFQRTHLIPPELGVQIFSLGIFLVYVIFSALLIRRFTNDVWRIRLSTALVAFWPYSFHNCVRVHNDTLATAWMIVTFYFTVCFYQERKAKHLYLAGAAAALALLTKSSGYIVVATLLLVLFLTFVRSRDRLRHVRRSAIVVAMIGAAMVLNTLGKGEQPMRSSGADSLMDRRGALCQKLLGTACDINPATWVGNDVFNYVWFDVRSFLAEPYVIRDRDDTGRQYFLNHLVKSSLFGTHNTVADRETAYELNVHVAAVLNALLFGMIVYLVVAFGHLKREHLRRYAVILIGIVLSVAFAAAFRFLIPAPHHVDFRHIFPVLSLVAVAYASAVGYFGRRRSVLQHVGYVLAVPFILLSIFYFWPKYDWALSLTARTVQLDLSAYAKIVPEGTPWDKPTNLLIEGNHTLDFKVAPRQTVSEVDISVDNNDVYEIVLVGANESRTLTVGPSPKPIKGLARYVQKVDPPVEQVSKVTMHPVSGDRAYSMGHLVVR